MRPRGPNENTNAIEVVNGGEISGRKVKKSISPETRRAPRTRSTVKAKIRPTSVPATPTIIASSRLLPSARRFFGAVTAANRPPRLSCPSSTKARDSSISRG